MKPGDIIFCPDQKFGHNRFYMIEGCHYGALDQQSVIEIRSLTERPGCAYGRDLPATTFVPEPLLRGFTVYTPNIAGRPATPPPAGAE